MKKRLLIALASLSISLPAIAEDSTIVGVYDCGQWIAAQRKIEVQKAWLLGYMSGLNYMYDISRKPPMDFLGSTSSAEQIFLWVDNYCQKNPLENLAEAGTSLFFELMRK